MIALRNISLGLQRFTVPRAAPARSRAGYRVHELAAADELRRG